MAWDDERPAGGPGDEDDPFAFSPDDRDRSTAGGPDAGADPVEPADPAPTGPDRADRDRTPPAPRRRKAGGRRPLNASQADRVRTVAEDAAAHARRVGGRWLAVAMAVLVALVVIQTVTGGPDRDGGDVAAGEQLPDFAAPLATAPALGDNDDVNLATKDGQGQAGNTAACKIQNASVVTSCGLLRRGPLVLVVFSRGVDSCVRVVDELDAARRRHPGLQTLAVSLLGRRDSTGETVRSRRWTLPVVYDRDGALGRSLGTPACPLVLFVRPDGTVRQRIIGTLDAGELEAGIRRLLAPPSPSGTTTSPAAAVAVDGAAPGR